MRCPVCRQEVGDDPLYQVSYPGQKEYVTPRCLGCLNKLMEKRAKKRQQNGMDR